MNWKEAKKIKVGSIVRRSWETNNSGTSYDPEISPQHGIVLAKFLEENIEKREKTLCQVRDKRYWLTVSWFKGPTIHSRPPASTDRVSSWDLMIVSHA